MSDITKKSLTEIVSLIKKKEIKSEELTQSFIKNINNDKKLNSFITNCAEAALKKSKNFDKSPKLDTLLPGVPIAVKDLFCTQGVKTTAGSKMLENFVPTYESTVTSNLWNEGAFLLGKLNCDEYAMGSSNETSYFGNVMNPIAENTVPGGSSGGYESALAAELTPATIGTDTGV
jgi:aspartyl-tRNA(Asn)/glutamyl-tRNA(Gln) amidotransferase subunit A